jgi:hypothetical protein
MGASSTIRRLVFNRWALLGGTLAVVVAMGVRSEWTLLQYRRTIASALKLKPAESVPAPWKFRVFGEPGYSEIELTVFGKPGTDETDEAQRELEKLKRAFPETQITTKQDLRQNWQERYGKTAPQPLARMQV